MFSKKRLLVAGAIFLIVLNTIVFSFYYLHRPSFKSAAVYTLFFFLGPVESVFSYISSNTVDLFEHYVFLTGVAAENKTLRNKLAAAHARLGECREKIKLYQRVRPFADLVAKSPDLKFLPASIVAKDPSPWYTAAMINRGDKDGIKAGFPVLVPDGLVGRVTAVSYEYAKVILITDPNSSVDALVDRTRARGIVTGEGGGMCRFDYVLRKSDVRMGDMVITSGFGGIFPKGIPIGRVTSLIRRNSGLFQQINVTPCVDLDKLEEVMVVVNFEVAGKFPE